MNFPRRAVVQGLMWAFVAIEFEVINQSFMTIGSGVVTLQINVFVFQRSPEPFDEDVVEGSATTIHADLNPACKQSFCVRTACELNTLICVEDLRDALFKSLIQSRQTELHVHAVGQSPAQNVAAVPVHDSHQIQESSTQRKIRDVAAPNLVGTINDNVSQQIRIHLVAWVAFGGGWTRSNPFQAHQSH